MWLWFGCVCVCVCACVFCRFFASSACTVARIVWCVHVRDRKRDRQTERGTEERTSERVRKTERDVFGHSACVLQCVRASPLRNLATPEAAVTKQRNLTLHHLTAFSFTPATQNFSTARRELYLTLMESGAQIIMPEILAATNGSR